MNPKSIIERRDGEGEGERDWKNERTNGSHGRKWAAEALSRAQGSGCWRFLLLMSFFYIYIFYGFKL
ncbi:hypothetical protein PRUPE_6G172700 [Prunus persica]|uniref:Uncharacterized protein n=1 Tax=Prunus persica TaxID=3760 RepID=A0A251NRR4_PRUPE|nr:hypothetical protein PRUPE_6G172700 [Prunus persica]